MKMVNIKESCYKENKALSLLSKEEIDMIQETNNTKHELEYKSISQVFNDVASENEENIAVIWQGKKYTYGDLLRTAKSVAKLAISKGLNVDDKVAFMLKKSFMQVSTIYGLVYAGIGYIPIEYESPIERIIYCMKESKAAFLITDIETKKKIEEEFEKIGERLFEIVLYSEIPISDNDIKPVVTNEHSLFAVIFTSGSTGNPKGVMLECINVFNLISCLTSKYKLSNKDSLLSVTNVCHDLCIFDYFSMILNGGKLILPDEDKNKDPSHWAELLLKYPVTVWLSVPTIMRLIFMSVKNEFNNIKFTTLRIVQLGGEFITEDLYKQVRYHMPSAEIYNIGCPTETTVINIIHKITEKDIKKGIIPYGKPIWNTQYFILNEDMQLARVGEEGIIYNGGYCVTRGYLSKELTKERYIIHPDLNIRLYNTGDLGKYDEDGNVILLGRADNQVKINGKRIELEEIEKTIDSCSIVSKSIVSTVTDENNDKELGVHIELINNVNSDNDNVENWKKVFDETYDKERNENSKDNDFSGWHSSYTGKQIPINEMTEWTNNTVKRILELDGNNVLEVGCGTGLLLRQIAPNVKKYVGMDLSTTAIEDLKKKRANENWNNVELFQGSADDLSKVKGRKFDVIIINSVIMFFPNAQYLLNVIESCMELLEDGGKLFLGDIHNYDLQKLFKTSIEVYNAKEETVLDIKNKVKEDCIKNKDLYVAEKFFEILYNKVPSISGICIKEKNTIYKNEMSKFRYDAIIYKNKSFEKEEEDIIDFDVNKMNLNELENYLSKTNKLVHVKNITNKLLYYDIKTLNIINEKSDNYLVKDIKRDLNLLHLEGIYPYELYNLAEKLKLNCAVKLNDNNKLHAIFSKKPIINVNKDEGNKKLDDYVSSIIKEDEDSKFIEKIYESISKKLPMYMIPAKWKIVNKLPQLPNGKIDRKSLLKEDIYKFDQDNFYSSEEESGDLHNKLLLMWQRYLKIKNVNDNQSFFAQGGHSLLAIRLLNEINKKFNVSINFSEFAYKSSVNEVAQIIKESAASKDKDNIVLLQDNENKYEEFELSDIQRSYYLGRNNIKLGNAPTHVYINVPVHNLNINKLEKSFNILINRHDSLRCIIHEDLKQKVLKDVPNFKINVIDLSGFTEKEQKEKADEIASNMLYKKYDLSKFPNFDLLVTYLGKENYEIHTIFDSVMVDGASIAILEDDLIKIYKGIKLEDLSVNLRDYMISSKRKPKDNSLKYWEKRILTLPEAPALPTLPSNFEVKNPKVYRKEIVINHKYYKKLKSMASVIGVSSSVVQLTAYAVILSRWSGMKHFTLNIPMFNKIPFNKEVENLTGEFGSLIFLEINLNNSITFAEACANVQKQLYEDFEHNDIGGLDILRIMEKEGRHSSFPVVFTSLTSAEDRKFSRKDYPIKKWESQSSGVWIDCITVEKDTELEIAWDCYEGTIKNDILDEMFDAYGNFIKTLGESDFIWQKDLTGIIPIPNMKLIEKYNKKEIINKKDIRLLHYKFYMKSLKDPDAVAIKTKDKILTYREVFNISAKIAKKIGKQRKDELTAIIMDKSYKEVAAAIGILFAGGGYVPISPTWPKERINTIIDAGKIERIIVDKENINKYKEYAKEVIPLDEEYLKGNELENYKIDLNEDPKSIAYVIYTSGSTGKPKGVVIEHGSVVNTINDINERFNIDKNDTTFALSEMYFDLSVYDIFGPLSVGGSIYIPNKEEKADVSLWNDILIKHNITIWNTVPKMMSMLMDYNINDIEENISFEDLRLVMMSGDWIPTNLPDIIKDKAKNAKVVSLGGATEASIWSNYYYVNEVPKEWNSIPYGFPLKNQQMYIMNDMGEFCPTGVCGNICIGGIGLARGYLNEPKLTSEKFVMHKGLNKRLYITGDIGKYKEDGSIEFLGRIDNQVKLDGFRIELQEIEKALEDNEGVEEAIVSIYESEKIGKKLVAFIKCKTKIEGEDLRNYLLEKLPEYMVPKAWKFMNKFPLTPTGKVDRKKLTFNDSDFLGVNNFEDKIEDSLRGKIKKIEMDILGLSYLDYNDRFFEVGGNSLKLAKLKIEIQKQIGINISILKLMEYPTIQSLCDFIENENKQGDEVSIRNVDKKRKELLKKNRRIHKR